MSKKKVKYEGRDQGSGIYPFLDTEGFETGRWFEVFMSEDDGYWYWREVHPKYRVSRDNVEPNGPHNTDGKAINNARETYRAAMTSDHPEESE